MSSSDSFKDRLKRTQSNIWKSANKLFGRNVSGGGVEDFVSGGGIMADFPPVGKGKGSRLANPTVQAYMRSTGQGYDDFVEHYRTEVTEGGKTAEQFRREIEQYDAQQQNGARRSGSPSRSPRPGASPVRAPLNVTLPQEAAVSAGPSSGASSPRGRSRGNASPSFMAGFSSPMQAQGKWMRKSPLRSAAAIQKEKDDYAVYKAEILRTNPKKPAKEIREDWLKYVKTRNVIIGGQSYPKPPVQARGPNAKKSPLKIVIDREYSTPSAPGQKKNKKLSGDIFLQNNPQYRELSGEDRFNAFMNDVYFQSAEYLEGKRRRDAEAARPKKQNLWQQATADVRARMKKDETGPRRSFKAFKGYEAGSPERMAYEKLYEAPKDTIRKVWTASPQYQQFNNSGRDVNRFFRNR